MQRTSDVAAAGVLLLGIIVLLGWTFDIDPLKRVVSGYVTMNPLTSVCFIASGLALWMAGASTTSRAISLIIAALILATATLQLIADMTYSAIQPDEILFPIRIDQTIPLSRMAPSTAVGFILGAISLALIQARSAKGRIYGQYFALALGSIALFSSVAYTYGAGTHAILRPFNLMAIHTSWGLFVLSLGLLFRDTSTGLAAFIMSRDSAGQLLRLMIPAVIVVPALLGWLSVRAQQSGFFGTSMAVTMLATFSVILLFIQTIMTARMIQKADTERRHRLSIARASEERLSGILSIAADAIISIDGDQKITLFNDWAERLFGYSRSEVIGQSLNILLPQRFREAHTKHIREFGGSSIPARRMGGTGLIYAQRKDGTTFPAEASISKLQIDGQMIYTVVLRDMTEKQRADAALIKARDEAEAAARSQSEFLANMSHEIRTPLNSISGFTQLLLANDALQGDLRSQVKKIKNSAGALTTVVNDILDYSKLEEGMLTLSLSTVCPRLIVDNCISIVAASAAARDLELAVEIAPNLHDSYFSCDANRLQQILLNLLSNAIKFTENGRVTVTVTEKDFDEDCTLVHFAVADTGIGIAPDRMGRLFRRFSQVDSSASRNYGGTGLGLAICKRIVTLMGGEIGVESAPGKGSTFWFWLPLETVASPVKQEAHLPRAAGEAGAPRSILLVEDIELNREIAIAMLEQAGHVVDIACDGAQAIGKVAEQDYDLILMDIQMPVMDGVTATRRIRALAGRSGSVPIIAMTANVLPDEVIRFREAGMNGHIRKPVEIDDLLAQINKWTSNAFHAA